jgi:hypothetical protein
LIRRENTEITSSNAGAHIEYWGDLVQAGQVAGEYDEYPHGRVSHGLRSEMFKLLAAPCILRREDIVTKILDRLNLPDDTVRDRDDHYRCPHCMGIPATEQI